MSERIDPIRRFDPEKVPKSSNFPEVTLPPPPYDIEIGCGAGYHPIQYASRYPERNLIAIERTHERFAKFLGRIQGNSAGANLIPIHSDALIWIVHHIPLESVARYFFLYPNPFPKNRRWYAMPFMQYVIESLMPEGTISLATNIEEYHLDAEKYFRDYWGMEILESRKLDRDSEPRTHFEKKYLERGENCWNLEVRKPLDWSVDDCVPHALPHPRH